VAAEAAARAGGELAQSGLLEQVRVLARRSIKRTTRQPAQLVFPLIFPLLLFAVNSSGLTSAAKLPHFPARDYRDFALAVPFMQGALFVAISAGTDLARDIETGFLNRLALTPVRGSALLVGQLGGALVVGLVQSVVYLLVGILVGVGIASGVGGALVLLALSTLIAFGFAGIGALLALRFGSGEAVQGFFPLLFVGVFLSSSNLPRNLIQTDWFRTIATYNPVSYLIEGVRSLIITGFDGRALALGFGIAGAIAIASMTAASVSLRRRLVRT
jgi:ABC-2 type transport system permease protein